ncbi:hypothetical protein C0Q70_06109 [Pomacea canaliculata]|uniref:Uncharacterized protein n=1 Tax=Pomacea canaliculata TaxID=400727 RepID=A0A2T7PN38_POMCA|nr:hypothetical protein C0Q70_06109 [Pomacea canaliculata]
MSDLSFFSPSSKPKPSNGENSNSKSSEISEKDTSEATLPKQYQRESLDSPVKSSRQEEPEYYTVSSVPDKRGPSPVSSVLGIPRRKTARKSVKGGSTKKNILELQVSRDSTVSGNTSIQEADNQVPTGEINRASENTAKVGNSNDVSRQQEKAVDMDVIKYDHVYWPGLINADFNVKENKLPLDIQSHSD